MKKRSFLMAFAAVAACALLAACGAPAPSEVSSSQPAASSSAASVASSTPQTVAVTLYIGRDGDFREYPIDYEGELQADRLIDEIAGLTGWNLNLAGEVMEGPGGMTVCFSEESILFTGPPDPQKDEFHLFDAEDTAHTVLDSIQKTLQLNFTEQGGNPDNLHIYYCVGENQPLNLPHIGLTLPINQPYKWDAMVELDGGAAASGPAAGTNAPAPTPTPAPAASVVTSQPPSAGTASPFLVEYLMNTLPNAATQLAGAEFYEGEMVEIDGLRCQVIDVIVDGQTVALYAIGEGQSALYQFNEETRGFDLLVST